MRAIGSRLPTALGRLGCITLLAVPFAAIGTMTAVLTLRTLLRVATMQGWPTVPATIQSVELQSAGQSAKRVVASYTYMVDGKQYTGHRVSLYGPDNLGSFYEDVSSELHGYFARREPYPAHVNPKDPRDSVLKPVLRWTAIGFYLVFTVLFGGFGWALIIASIARLVRAHNEAVLMDQFPKEPWKWRVEWLKPAIKSSQGIDAITEICIAIFWNAATFPVLLVIPREVANGRYLALTFLVIPLIGIGLVGWAFVALARATRFAGTSLRLETMPGRPGAQLRGHISAPKALAGAPDVLLTLRCERTYVGSLPSGGTTTRNPGATGTEDIWRFDWPGRTVSGQHPSGEVTVPVAVDLPRGYPNSWRGPGDQFAWFLSASAPLKGADFSVEFEVPVFDP
jgi:Protein of unknown function (DUF3592)